MHPLRSIIGRVVFTFATLLPSCTVTIGASPPPQKPPLVDCYGDPLPQGVLARLGTIRLRPGNQITALAISPDGQMIAIAGKWYESGTKTFVGILNRSNGKIIQSFVIDGPRAEVVGFSNTGNTLVLGTVTTIYSWNVTSKRSAGRLSGHLVAFSGDRKRMAFHLFDTPFVCIYNADEMKEVLRVKVHPTPQTLALSRDGSILACGNDDIVRLCDVRTGKVLSTMDIAKSYAPHMAFSPDAKTIAGIVTRRDRTRGSFLYLWPIGTGKARRLGRLTELGLDRSLVFSSDGKMVATAGANDGSIQVWDVTAHKEKWRLIGHREIVQSIGFAGDCKTLISGSTDNTVRMWDLSKGKEVIPWVGHSSIVRRVVYAPDCQTIASLGDDATIRIWDLSAGRQVNSIAAGRPRQTAITELAFSPDSRLLALGGKSIELWSTKVWRQQSIIPGKTAIDGLAFSQDGRYLAATGDQLALWINAQTGRTIRRLPWPSVGDGIGGEGVRRWLAVSLDATGLVATNHLGLVVYWDLRTGKVLRRFGDGGVRHAVFRDAHTLVLWSESVVDRWEAQTGRQLPGVPIDRVQWERRVVYDGTLSRDGRYLIAFTNGGRIKVCETLSGRVVCSAQAPRRWLNCLAIAPDCRTFATAGDGDFSVLIWDLTGRQSRYGKLAPCSAAARELLSSWDDLRSENASRAHKALWNLVAAGNETVTFLGERFRRVRPVSGAELKGLLEDLDSDSFQAREQAAKRLEALRELPAPMLKNALAMKPSVEVRKRIERLLSQLLPKAPAEFQAIRGVAVLEYIRTDEARALLERLATGAPAAWVTREAQAALVRLGPGR